MDGPLRHGATAKHRAFLARYIEKELGERTDLIEKCGHDGSAIIATEFEVRYALQGIARLLEADLASIEVREDVFRDYDKELDDALGRMIWAHNRTTTYFRNEAAGSW